MIKTPALSLALLMSLGGLGCAPLLGNNDDDDATANDDDATANDDDATADDDDDATAADDDDDGGCDDPGQQSLFASGPPDADGEWITGSLSNLDGALLLESDAGDELIWRIEGVTLPNQLGRGRVSWWVPGLEPWGGDFVLAVEWGEGVERLLAANLAETDIVQIDDWALLASPVRGACGGSEFEDGCGVGQVLPLELAISTTEGLTELTLSPGIGVGSPELSVEHRFGREYVEVFCEDVPSLSWSFNLRQTMLIWDG